MYTGIARVCKQLDWIQESPDICIPQLHTPMYTNCCQLCTRCYTGIASICLLLHYGDRPEFLVAWGSPQQLTCGDLIPWFTSTILRDPISRWRVMRGMFSWTHLLLVHNKNNKFLQRAGGDPLGTWSNLVVDIIRRDSPSFLMPTQSLIINRPFW